MNLALCAVVGVACIVLAACAAVDSIDRIRDRDPVAILSIVVTVVCVTIAFGATYVVLSLLGAGAA